jgi:hypothetical protein
MYDMRTLMVVLLLFAGCARTPEKPDYAAADLRAVAIVPSLYEPAAQFDPGSSKANYADGAIIGATGGAGIGAMSAQASAGLLCTIGGPLCLIVVIPAAIVGGLIGGVAGAAVDAITTDPGGRIADARGAIEQAVAEMRLTDAVAAKTHAMASESKHPVRLEQRTEDFRALAAHGITSALEVGMDELRILPREKEMALILRARSRLYRTSDGELLDERVSEAQTHFRKYQDWAADEAEPLRRAVDAAVAQLSRTIVSEHLGYRPRADTAARRGG